MKTILSALFLTALASTVAAKPFDEMFPGHTGYEEAEVNEILQDFNYRQGLIVLPGGQAELRVPDGYYYLSIDDARTVLTTLWGNPDGESLGMIFPAEYTPWDDEAWGATIVFEGVGYVSDEDAESYDYNALLKEMQADTKYYSEERVRLGYDSMELIGWAEPPSYDRTARKLHWAQELQFSSSDEPTLNYDLRALGRHGVMNVTFIAGMHQLAQVKAALPDVAEMVEFVNGKRYSDFDPSVDQVAAYGVAGLIAGKALTSKAGFMAAAVLFLKKFWFVLLLPIFWLKNLFRRT